MLCSAHAEVINHFISGSNLWGLAYPQVEAGIKSDGPTYQEQSRIIRTAHRSFAYSICKTKLNKIFVGFVSSGQEFCLVIIFKSHMQCWI